MAGVGSKPGVRQGGRKRGTPNKLTADLKSMIEGALAAVGGQDYLEAVAIDRPEAFCTLLGKLIPKDIKLTMPVQEAPRSMLDVARRFLFLLKEAEIEAAQQKERATTRNRRT